MLGRKFGQLFPCAPAPVPFFCEVRRLRSLRRHLLRLLSHVWGAAGSETSSSVSSDDASDSGPECRGAYFDTGSSTSDAFISGNSIKHFADQHGYG